MLLIPFVLYIIARWRAHRRSRRGIRSSALQVALGYFASTAFQVGCAGLALVAYTVIGDLGEERGSLSRLALGLIVPGALVFAAHILYLRRTNQDDFPAVHRLFAGYNLLIAGTVGFIALVLLCEAAFKSGSSGELGKIAGALLVVYGTVWVVISMWLTRASTHVPLPPPPAPPPGTV